MIDKKKDRSIKNSMLGVRIPSGIFLFFYDFNKGLDLSK